KVTEIPHKKPEEVPWLSQENLDKVKINNGNEGRP
ncbi:unnamed protein product, partial [marine sediment metagenome]